MRGVDVLSCINLHESDNECGSTNNCGNCLLNISVINLFEKDTKTNNLKIDFGVLSNKEKLYKKFLLSTSKVEIENNTYAQVSLTDITSEYNTRKELTTTDKELSFIVNTMSDICSICKYKDGAFYIEFLNRSFEEFYNDEDIYFKPVEIKGVFLKDFFVKFDKNVIDKIYKNLNRAIEIKDEISFFESFEMQYGKYEFEVTISPILDDKGECEYLLYNAKDITEQNRNQKEKEYIQKQLYVTSELAAMGEFSTAVMHEINNPLTIIRGYIDLLKNDSEAFVKTNTKLKNRLDKIINSINKIDLIISGLIKSLRNQDDVAFVNVDILDVLIETKNLLDIIYNKEGLGNINILVSNKNDLLVIEFCDDGVGMKNEIKEKIFYDFYSTKPAGKSGGIGMGIIRTILSEFDGTIEIESMLEEGTKVVLTIPLIDEK